MMSLRAETGSGLDTLTPFSRGLLTHRGVSRASIHHKNHEIVPGRPVCRMRACRLARRSCERMQAHNTVSPGIAQRSAFQRSYRVPHAQKSTSLSSWPTRIGVGVILVHVGEHEMHGHEPVGQLPMKSPPGYSHLARTRHDISSSK